MSSPVQCPWAVQSASLWAPTSLQAEGSAGIEVDQQRRTHCQSSPTGSPWRCLEASRQSARSEPRMSYACPRPAAATFHCAGYGQSQGPQEHREAVVLECVDDRRRLCRLWQRKHHCPPFSQRPSSQQKIRSAHPCQCHMSSRRQRASLGRQLQPKPSPPMLSKTLQCALCAKWAVTLARP